MEVKEKKYIHSRPIFYCFLALLLSINATRFIFNLNIPYLVLISVLILGLISFLLFFKKYVILLIIISTLLFGVCWFFLGVTMFEGKTYYGEQIVEARVTDDITYGDEKTSYLLEDVKINGKQEKNMYLDVTGEGINLGVGDVITFNANIGYNSLFNLGSFNLSAYRDSAPYWAEVDVSNIEVIDSYLKFDEKFRLKVKNLLYENMGASNVATAFAVLFGNTNDIKDDIYNSYKDAGILHLLAVSGLNVTFLITLLGFILKLFKVNRFTNFAVCFIVLMLYVYLCGFAPSILRAGIMGLVFLATKLSGKCYDGLNTLGLSGIFILLFSPLSALDYGFLMSYFCVLGIFTIHPILTKGLQKVFPKFVADSFSISISSQLAILPFMAGFYSTFNFLSFFINLIVVPIFSVLYPVLFVSVLISICLPFMSFLLTACGWVLSLIFLIAKFFATTSLTVNLKPFNVVITSILALIIFGLSNYVMLSWKGKGVLTISLSVLLTIFALVFTYIPLTQVSILYSAYNDDELYIFTNSSNQSLVVDGGYYNNINNGLLCVNANNLIGYVNLKGNIYQDSMEKLGAGNYVCHAGTTSKSGSVILDYDKVYSVGDFDLKYVTFEGKLIGLEVDFDNYKNFILNGELTLEAMEYINYFNYDFLLIGKNIENIDIFDNENLISYYDTGQGYSFSNDGSLYFILQNNNFVIRRVD